MKIAADAEANIGHRNGSDGLEEHVPTEKLRPVGHGISRSPRSRTRHKMPVLTIVRGPTKKSATFDGNRNTKTIGWAMSCPCSTCSRDYMEKGVTQDSLCAWLLCSNYYSNGNLLDIVFTGNCSAIVEEN